jgi:hypothetical protein
VNGPVNIGGPSLNFSGPSNPIFGYGCQIVANSTEQELSITGWTASVGGVRKVTLYDDVYVSSLLNVEGTALVQNNPVASFTGTQCNLTVPGNLNVLGQVLQNGQVYDPASYMPVLNFNTNGYYIVIPPSTFSAFLSSPGSPYIDADVATGSTGQGNAFLLPNLAGSWLTGIDESSTPVTYKYMRVTMQAFVSSGGNATEPNSNVILISIKNTAVSLGQGPNSFPLMTDLGVTGVTWNIKDQGSSYGYCMQVSPWYAAPNGYVSNGNLEYLTTGTLAIQNYNSLQSIQIGSVTLQFR